MPLEGQDRARRRLLSLAGPAARRAIRTGGARHAPRDGGIAQDHLPQAMKRDAS